MAPDPRLVAITGAEGFVGRNLAVRLGEAGFAVRPIGHGTDADEMAASLGEADIVFHLAGANRPADPADFMTTNRDYAAAVAAAIEAGGRKPLVICSSTAKAAEDSDYGRSKQAGEQAMLGLGETGAATVTVYRLPNIFGKWARPDYNSAVATFCHNIARGLPIRIDDPAAPLSLLYVDDLIDAWLALLDARPRDSGFAEAGPVYTTTVGAVAEAIRGFERDRQAGSVAEVGCGLTRALYATFIAALPEAAFSYPLVAHTDPRGSFSEMIKTPASGQISYFTAHPGVTRGGHYHHSKVEKFLIVHGEARFRFRHILTGATHEVRTSGAAPVVVETIPGWAHDVTNVGDEVMIALLWANEVFDRARPDTIARPL
ncbi:MAG: family oxidoreductase [Sphingomonas bacterium]|uniref:polysaccharide biosynthesis C-terminal domain-containing protein n=1 Tax=Sphingomonas bacterium TaxID=1895847 RepID=UPI0026195693|nr:NAD-dependent epimerase/dehydratase family protein [Sphingomonas bacterium]MDB5706577.1 family oxidoreductase [Sphingomonas bacterium]